MFSFYLRKLFLGCYRYCCSPKTFLLGPPSSSLAGASAVCCSSAIPPFFIMRKAGGSDIKAEGKKERTKPKRKQGGWRTEMRRRPAYFFFSRRRRYLSSYAGPVLCLLRLLLILGFSSFSLRDTAGASLMRPIRRHLGVTWSRCGGNAEQAPLSSRAFPESPSPLPFFPRSCRRMRPNKVSEERPERLPSSPSPDKEMRRAKTRGSWKNKRGCHLKNTRRREVGRANGGKARASA